MPLMILNKNTKEFTFYGSLDPKLLDDFPELNKNTVNNYISRKKVPYEDDTYIIFKGKQK